MHVCVCSKILKCVHVLYIYIWYILMYRRIDMYIQREGQRERERESRKKSKSKQERPMSMVRYVLGLQRRPGLFDCRVCFSWPIKASTLSLGQEPGWGMMVLGTRDRHIQLRLPGAAHECLERTMRRQHEKLEAISWKKLELDSAAMLNSSKLALWSHLARIAESLP